MEGKSVYVGDKSRHKHPFIVYKDVRLPNDIFKIISDNRVLLVCNLPSLRLRLGWIILGLMHE